MTAVAAIKIEVLDNKSNTSNGLDKAAEGLYPVAKILQKDGIACDEG